MAETFKAESISAESIIAGGQLIGAAPGADLYIDPAGDDGNDGLSALTPVQSWERLFELIPLIIAQNTTVHMAAGEYQRLNAPVRIVNSDVTFALLGTTETVYEGTPDSWPAGTDQLPFVGSTPGWTPDALIGCFVVSGSWDPLGPYTSNFATIVPVMSNTADTITLAVNKPTAAWTYPLKILRPLCYVDTTLANSYTIAGWAGTGRICLVNLEARQPYQFAFSLPSNTPRIMVIGAYLSAKHPTYTSFLVTAADSYLAFLVGCHAKDSPLANSMGRGAYFYRCWGRSAGGATCISTSGTLVLVIRYGCRMDNFSYGVECYDNTNLTTVNYTSAGDALLGTCTTAGIYVQNGSSARVAGGAGNTLSGPMGQNVLLGDGTYKAYTDASAGETTQFTRWIKG